MLKVELLLSPKGISICYLTMSVVPRVGDEILLIANDHIDCMGKVTGVRWLIDLGDSQIDQSDGASVSVELNENDPDFEAFHNYLMHSVTI